MADHKPLTLDTLLDNGVQPTGVLPKSERLDTALAAAACLNVVELTYLYGRIGGDLETYRATIVNEALNRKPNGIDNNNTNIRGDK